MSNLSPVEALYQGMVRYAEDHGLHVPPVDFASVRALPERSRRIAAAYEAAPVFDPNAVPAYRAFRKETARQFEFLTRPVAAGGLGIEIVIWARDPYPGAAAMMADPLLAQSAVDRLVSTAHELIIEGDSYRRRQKPSHDNKPADTGVSVDQQNGDHHAH